MEKNMKKILSLVFVLVLSSMVFADVRLPDTPKPTPTPKGKQIYMRIQVDSAVSEPTLTISKGSLKKLKAVLDEVDLDANDNVAQIETEQATPSVSKTQSVMAGVFLSLAFVFGGIWFVRSKSKVALGIIGIAILGTAATITYANVRPPQLFKFNSSIFSSEMGGYGYAQDKVRIKIIEQSGNDMTLSIPRQAENTSSKDGE
jgi:hypothetical protein